MRVEIDLGARKCAVPQSMTAIPRNQSALRWLGRGSSLEENKRAGISPALCRSLLDQATGAVVHRELDRMGGHAEIGYLFHLQIDVGVQHVVREHPAAREEVAVFVEVLERHVERRA